MQLTAELRHERHELRRAILDTMAAWPRVEPTPAAIDSLMLQLFRFQARAIAPYGRLCASRGVAPDQASALAEIPLVPVAAFKYAPFATPMARPAAVRFDTSGTTDGQPGRIELPDTAAYDLALQQTFAHFVVPDAARYRGVRPFRCLSLVPTQQARPHSSLGYMVRRLAQRWDDGAGAEFLGDSSQFADGLDVAGLVAACQRASAQAVPVILFATTLALDIVLQRWPVGVRVALPAGSRLMDTGGPKGRRLHVSRADQHQQLIDILGLDPQLLVGELGMTELASQRYEGHVRRRTGMQVHDSRGYLAPPWLRSRVVDVASGLPCAPGQMGLIGHLDLANLDSLAFILTADLGHVDEHGGLHLQGRLPGSEWRGCGLDAEEITGMLG